MNVPISCLKIERKALLDFEQGLIDPFGRLSSWESEHCCQWNELSYNNSTRNIVKLDLRNPFQSDEAGHKESALRGKISSSLLFLKHLDYLDLSLNDFERTQIPNFIGSLKSLSYLNVFEASCSGDVSPHLGNISSLHYLDLHVSADSDRMLTVKDLHWLTCLSSLEYLDLGGINLGSVANWLEVVNMLQSLLELHLNDCNLKEVSHTLSSVNFTSLATIDLSRNIFNSTMPIWIFNISSLEIICYIS